MERNELIIPEWLFEEPIENEINQMYNSKSLKQRATDSNKLDDKKLNKVLAKKMIKLYFFTDRIFEVGFNITLESHHINHANCKLIIKPNYLEFGLEALYTNKIIKELSVIYSRLIYQYKLKYQTVFPARCDKQDEDNQVSDETEIFINLNINDNLTESDLDKIDVRSPLEHQIQQQEMKDSGWRFDKINSMTVYFLKLVKWMN